MDLQIKKLVDQLGQLGYREFQIQSILREVAGEELVDTLTPAQVSQVVESLEEYIVFAQKCKQKK